MQYGPHQHAAEAAVYCCTSIKTLPQPDAHTLGSGSVHETAARGVSAWVCVGSGRAHRAVGEGCDRLVQHRQQQHAVGGSGKCVWEKTGGTEAGVPSHATARGVAARDSEAHFSAGRHLPTFADDCVSAPADD